MGQYLEADHGHLFLHSFTHYLQIIIQCLLFVFLALQPIVFVFITER